MSGPHPATAAVRLAVRASLADLPPGALLLAAVSGGADSMALAEGLAFTARRTGHRAGAVVVDHALQPGSDAVAQAAADRLAALALDPVVVRQVRVDGGGSLEAAARDARYAALTDVADGLGAAAVLLGHTLDDQAEQVLLGLVRGSGARSLSGMPRARGPFRRPLLGVTREQTRASCVAEGLQWWDDPMNDDAAFTRVRVRQALLDLERDLGPGVAAALARTADQLREDADHLDGLAATAVTALGAGPWAVEALATLPPAVRSRVWRRLLLAHGAPAGQVSTRHTRACDALLTDWHGQGPVSVPGHLRVIRGGGRVSIVAATPLE